MPEISELYKQYTKGFQMRNTMFRQKNRISDLEGLRDVVKAKVVGTIKFWNFLKQKFFYLLILGKEFSIILGALGAVGIKLNNFVFRGFRLFVQLLLQMFFDSTSLSLSRSKIQFFGWNFISGLLIWFTYFIKSDHNEAEGGEYYFW